VSAELELPGDWDAARLERVVDNLIGNAIKYSPAGGEVTLTLHQASADGDRWAVLTVADQGLGIPAADLAHVFAPFGRGSNVGEIAGTGVGLAGVKQIVEQHGGRVGVESDEGQGSTFTIWLPLV
jgi:signal transduction histidine kinase